MPTPGFLFIKKCSDSLSLSNSRNGSRSTIFRHVQIGRRRPRKKETHMYNDDDDDEEAHPGLQTRKETQRHESLLFPGIVSALGPSEADLSHEELEMLRFFLPQSLTSNLDAHVLPSTQKARYRRFSSLQHANLRSAIIRGHHGHALLAATAARMSTLPGLSQYRIKAMRLIHHCMQDLRHRLGEYKQEVCVDKQILNEIVLLCAAVWFLGDVKEAVTHLGAAKHFVRSLEAGPEDDWKLLETIQMGDLFLALESGKLSMDLVRHGSCKLPEHRLKYIHDQIGRLQSQQAEGPESISMKASYSKSNQTRSIGSVQPLGDVGPGDGFMRAIEAGVLGEGIARVLQENYFQAWLEMAEYDKLGGEMIVSDIEWLGSIAILIAHDLVALPSSTEDPGSLTEIQSRQGCCLLALLILLGHVVTPMAFRAGEVTAQRMVTTIRTAESNGEISKGHLENNLETTKGPQNLTMSILPSEISDEVYLWALITGLSAFQDRTFSPSLSSHTEDKFLLVRAMKLAIALRCTTYNKLLQLSRKFLYFAPLQHTTLIRVADQIEIFISLENLDSNKVTSGETEFIWI